MRCAIVGSGLAALASYATLRHAGVRPEEIAVFGTHADPTSVWRERAESIRQQRMRSESEGHLAAPGFPGLAVREGTLIALARSVTNRYHPSVELFLAHAQEVRARTGWDSSFVERRVAHVVAADGGFVIDGEGQFEHVLIATGHPGLVHVSGAVHAYEPHDYEARVVVIGAGMAAATEWRNALAAGAEVVSVRRREPLRRPLNVPRSYFSKRGLAGFHRLPPAQRVEVLHDLGRPSYPPGREWDFDVPVAETPPPGYQVIAATGFRKGWREDALLADLVASHDLETHDRYLALAPESTVPALTDDRRTLSIAGIAGQWSFPAADTIAGAKYAARAFTRRVCRTR
ncbi:MAG TPA: FAD-dependent oxidoreductase [Gaiellaceae bacterium]|nr:FAD-dependent oxidoreductase [Gaiellaceae bacterium]